MIISNSNKDDNKLINATTNITFLAQVKIISMMMMAMMIKMITIKKMMIIVIIIYTHFPEKKKKNEIQQKWKRHSNRKNFCFFYKRCDIILCCTNRWSNYVQHYLFFPLIDYKDNNLFVFPPSLATRHPLYLHRAQSYLSYHSLSPSSLPSLPSK